MAILHRKSSMHTVRWCRKNFWIKKKQSLRSSYPISFSKVWWKLNELWLQKRRGKEAQEKAGVYDGSVFLIDAGKKFENDYGHSYAGTVQRLEVRKGGSPLDRTLSHYWRFSEADFRLFSFSIVGRRSLLLRRGQPPESSSEMKITLRRNLGHIILLWGNNEIRIL